MAGAATSTEDHVFDDAVFGGGWGDEPMPSATPTPAAQPPPTDDDADDGGTQAKHSDQVARVLGTVMLDAAIQSGDLAMQSMVAWLQRRCIHSVAMLVARAFGATLTNERSVDGEEAPSPNDSHGLASADESELLLFGQYITGTVRLKQAQFVGSIIDHLAARCDCLGAMGLSAGRRSGRDVGAFSARLAKRWHARLCLVLMSSGLPVPALAFAPALRDASKEGELVVCRLAGQVRWLRAALVVW